jgi:hypothetical protein
LRGFKLRAIRTKVRTALFWAITQRVAVIPYGRFGITYRFHLHGSSILEDGIEGCSETSLRNYNFSLHNAPEERSCHLFPDGSLKSRIHTKFRENQATVANVKNGDTQRCHGDFVSVLHLLRNLKYA